MQWVRSSIEVVDQVLAAGAHSGHGAVERAASLQGLLCVEAPLDLQHRQVVIEPARLFSGLGRRCDCVPTMHFMDRVDCQMRARARPSVSAAANIGLQMGIRVLSAELVVDEGAIVIRYACVWNVPVAVHIVRRLGPLVHRRGHGCGCF
jgi:hypothetical protein